MSQCRRRQVTAKGRRWGGGEEGGEGKTEAPREQDSAEWPCCGCDSWLLPRAAPERAPQTCDTSCVIISITVSYILTRRQHGVRHLPNGICPRGHVRSKDKPLTLEVAGPRGGLEPRPAGHTQGASHCVAGEGPQLQGLGFLICELGILCLPCPPLSEDDLRWTCVGVVCEVVTK